MIELGARPVENRLSRRLAIVHFDSTMRICDRRGGQRGEEAALREEVIWEEDHSRFLRLTDVDQAPPDAKNRPILMYASIGDQSKTTLAPDFERLYAHLEANAPALFLSDMSQLGETDLATKWFAAERIKKQRPFIEKSAVFGAAPKLIAAAGAILRVAGRNDVRLFPGRTDAIDWLFNFDRAASVGLSDASARES